MFYYLVGVLWLVGSLVCLVGLFHKLPLFLGHRSVALVAGVALLFGASWLMSKVEPARVKAERAQREAAKAAEALEAAKPHELELTAVRLASACGGACLTMSGTISNPTERDRKDPTIKCTYFGESGSVVGVERRTLYRLVPAGKIIKFRGLSLGLRPEQGAESNCVVLASIRVG